MGPGELVAGLNSVQLANYEDQTKYWEAVGLTKTVLREADPVGLNPFPALASGTLLPGHFPFTSVWC